MQFNISDILNKKEFDKEDLIQILNSEGNDKTIVFKKAAEIKSKYIGNKVYFRGLIEFSNICKKNCLYCGIRAGNTKTHRYQVTEDEIIDAVKFIEKNRYGSMVLQSGERNDKEFTAQITDILKKIKEISKGKIGITLSLGEQDEKTYREWFDNGAHRYLIRIETSNKELYKKIHPDNLKHNYENRLDSLNLLKKIGYQVGTGVMIGLPFQTISDLADDLLFFRNFDIDMVGMGPYIEHEDTPLYKFKDTLIPKIDRFNLSLKMVAALRIMMKDINIAATTAMQALDPMGREKALKVGANIIMPNLTPTKYRSDYQLYEDKPCLDEDAEECKSCLEARIHMAGDVIGFDEWGDSKHFFNKQKDQS